MRVARVWDKSREVVAGDECGKIIRKQKFHAMYLSFILLEGQQSFFMYILI